VTLYSKEPIKTLADYKGKKIRYASITNKQMLEALGAAPDAYPAFRCTGRDVQRHRRRRRCSPHEAGLAYDLASVVKYSNRAAVSVRPHSRWL
jgi:hypothetical protein